MVAFFLPYLLLLATSSAIILHEYFAAICLAILGSTWCLCKLHDERVIRILLIRRIQSTQTKHHEVISRRLLLSTLKYARDTLLNQAFSQTLESAVQPSLVRQNPLQSADQSSSHFYERVLESLHTSTSADLALVAIRQSNARSPLILTNGSTETRLQAVLSKILAPIVNGTSDCPSEASIIHSPESPFSALASFGYKLAIARSFKEAQSAPPGVFLLLYRDTGRFGHHLVNQLDTLTSSLESELTPLRAIYELTTQVQQAETQNKIKSDVLASISHDMRSPLNNIRSILHLMSTEPISTEAREMLDVASTNCDSAAEILETVLDFLSHQAGRLIAKRTSFNICALLRDVVNAYRVAAKVKGLDLVFNKTEESVTVLADHRQIRRVLSNVLSNAIKYTEHGSITINLVVLNNSNVRVSVRDTGIGMNSEQVAQLFKPFTRFNPKSTEGVGLGLALSKALLELNSASISVSSFTNQGSEFCLTFAISAQKQIAPSSLSQHAEPIKKIAVLLIDDDHDACLTLARALGARSIDCATAITMRDAISLLTYQSFDAIISDSNMPDGGAAEILEYLSTQTAAAPVLVLTGSTREAEMRRLVALGAIEILKKPASIDEIVAALQNAAAQNSKPKQAQVA